jgi:hypothetical protein
MCGDGIGEDLPVRPGLSRARTVHVKPKAFWGEGTGLGSRRGIENKGSERVGRREDRPRSRP